MSYVGSGISALYACVLSRSRVGGSCFKDAFMTEDSIIPISTYLWLLVNCFSTRTGRLLEAFKNISSGNVRSPVSWINSKPVTSRTDYIGRTLIALRSISYKRELILRTSYAYISNVLFSWQALSKCNKQRKFTQSFHLWVVFR